MKAVDYFEQYGERICEEFKPNGDVKPISDLVVAFGVEMKEIMENRHVKTDAGALSVLKEQNQKWNALCSVFEKKKGFTPIIRNGFLLYMNERIPGVIQAIDVWRLK